jgi:hypothetical protein
VTFVPIFLKGRGPVALVRFTQKVGEGRGDVVLIEQRTRGQGVSIVDNGIECRRANK